LRQAVAASRCGKPLRQAVAASRCGKPLRQAVAASELVIRELIEPLNVQIERNTYEDES
jgi:hypothetical protein